MAEGAARPAKKNILVVDDDADLRRGIAMLLAGEFEVREAENGEACLRAVEQARPDLVLLDVAMPGMTGIDVLREFRAKDRNTPVLMLTAQTDIELARQALELGAAAYITKPFDFGELRAEVRRACEGRSPDVRGQGYRPWRVAGS
jgi:DNA-binding response OmpR family regulator